MASAVGGVSSLRRLVSVLLVALSLGGCEALYLKPMEGRAVTMTETLPSGSGGIARSAGPGAVTRPLPDDGEDDEASAPIQDYYRLGSEQFAGRASKLTKSPPKGDGVGDVTLNFQTTNILEVVKVILGDLLQLNYRVDEGVTGNVTLQTSNPIPPATLLPTLEMLLRSNNAALVHDGELYHVVPREKALQGYVTPQLGDTKRVLPPGYQVRIVPLRFIAAKEMHKILEPFASPGSIVRVDSPRNLLVLAGAGAELARLMETVEVFDVDWLAGMSIALFRPERVDAKTLAEELRTILDNDEGPLDGVVRIVELERVNAVLVVTPRKVYLERVADWIAQLDQDTEGPGQRLYVYHVQNGRAADLADVLSQVYDDQAVEPLPRAELAPGLRPVETSSRGAQAAAAEGQTQTESRTRATPRQEPERANRQSTGADEGLAIGPQGSVRIIADEVNNALLIKASPAEYKSVEAALKRLDIVPLQVLVEATIAEITLTDELEFGLEWFFKNSIGNKKGVGTLDLFAGVAGLSPIPPGFSYAISDAAGVVRAVLNTLASESKLDMLSSPSLMVLNNQTATINVGDEVPVTTQQQQSTTTAANIVNTIEFRDTGVLLTVTPRVNAGGLVTMEVEQEVSNVAPGTGDSLTPTIQQRRITSTLAVNSGETVVLGGLIRETDNFVKAGIPVLHELPLIGGLFGTTDQEQRRTELVVLITPRAVQSADSARDIIDEFREKMGNLRPFVTRDQPLIPPASQ